MNYELSICIPTYNRAEYLKEALDSIIKQINDTNRDKVEICISDNASEDNTKELIENYRKKHKHIRYFCWDKNMGHDNNFLKCVEISHGKYSWILGSDDTIKEGAIDKILDEIKLSHGIYLFNRTDCDINLNIIRDHKFFKDETTTRVFTFGKPEDLELYIESAKTLAALFGYLSSTVFLKEKWDSVEFDRSFIGSAFSYTYILLSTLKTENSLKYIDEYLVYCRTGNDSFLVDGIEQRLMIDIDGYSRLFDAIFSEYIDTKYYLNLIFTKTFKFSDIFYFMSISKNPNIIEEGFIRIGYSKIYFLIIKILKYPYLFMRYIKRIFKAKRNS